MESEKVKEIKKVLECCKDRLCEVCPRLKQEPNQEEDCRLALIGQSLTLINELESENEKLKQHKRELQGGQQDLISRIAELEKENAIKTDTITDLLKKQEFYEKEKLTKFAEMLKESAGQHYVRQNGVRISDITYSISDGTINKILKECLCDNNQ